MEWHFRNRVPSQFSYSNEHIHLPMKEAWSLTLSDAIHDTPILVGDSIYVATLKDLYKLDANTGKSLWVTEAETTFYHSPAYYEDKIYMSANGTFYCLDDKNGEELWRQQIGFGGDSCCFHSGRVILKHGEKVGHDYIYGFASYLLEDMSREWFHKCQGRVNTTSGAVAEGIFVYGDNAGNVYGIDIYSGKEIWNMRITDWIPPWVSAIGKIETPCLFEVPVIVGDKVIISAETPGRTFGLDLRSGRVLWFFNVEENEKWNYFGLGIDETQFFCFSMDRRYPRTYNSIDIYTGEVRLHADISAFKDQLGDIHSKTGLLMDDYHFVGVYEPPKVVAFHKITGEVVWTHSINRSNLRGDSAGIFADGKLIWGRVTGDIYCFQ